MTAQTEDKVAEPTRLARKLNTFDAIVIGLGSMIGAGVFVVVGPAAQAAGTGLLAALVMAALVAYCNALSSAQLAALYPESGGAYVYGRKRLGAFWGFLAGWGFVVGKLASCAAMALTFASYAVPQWMRPLAVTAVLVMTTVNYFGIEKTAMLTRAVVIVVLVSLGIVVAATLYGREIESERLMPVTGTGPYGVLQAAGLWFFAFAGYARLATLGEEVVDPARTIPRAIPIAFGITLLVYAAVAITALLAVDVDTLARAAAPLATAVEAGGLPGWSPVVRLGATVASLGVLLSLVVGVSRTAFSMAANRDLPRFFAAVHPRYRVPHRAELGVGILVGLTVAFVDLRSAIGFSAFTVLTYYAVTNASAFTLKSSERRWPRWVAFAGLAGCAILAFTLPLQSILAGSAVLATGAAVFLLRARHSPSGALGALSSAEMTSVSKYPPSAVRWHWILAAFVFVLYGIGWYMVDLSKGTPPVAYWYNLHKSFGIVVAIPIAWLLLWRTQSSAPPLSASMPDWEIKASHLNHALLYICLVVLVVSGFIESNFTKWGIKFFGIHISPLFSENEALYRLFNRIHVYTSYFFSALIAIHIGGALKHWLVDRDGVLQRMLPGR